MIAAATWLILGLAVAAAGSRMQLGTLSAPGSGLLPTLAGGVLAALGAVVLYAEWRPTGAGIRPHAAVPVAGERWRVTATVIALVAYSALLGVLGLSVTTFLVLGVLFRFVARLGWAASLGWTVGATLFSHVLFRMWLKVPFPPGPWGF